MIVILECGRVRLPPLPLTTQKNKDMKTLGYCVAIATIAWWCLNGGTEADTTTLTLTLVGIIASLAMMASHREQTDRLED